jgi:mannose-1-phosphate guanylyltransferase / mannose-6-phosphate isomerase
MAIKRDERPWGYYEVLATDNMTQIKKIVVRDQQQLSLQTHEHRDEHWFCAAGNGLVTIDDAEIHFTAGMTIQILRGEKHRVKSLAGDLVFYEVQVGSYLGEDDIVRYEDNYGRATGGSSSAS